VKGDEDDPTAATGMIATADTAEVRADALTATETTTVAEAEVEIEAPTEIGGEHIGEPGAMTDHAVEAVIETGAVARAAAPPVEAEMMTGEEAGDSTPTTTNARNY
jgi:hypothetical protein